MGPASDGEWQPVGERAERLLFLCMITCLSLSAGMIICLCKAHFSQAAFCLLAEVVFILLCAKLCDVGDPLKDEDARNIFNRGFRAGLKQGEQRYLPPEKPEMDLWEMRKQRFAQNN